MKKFTLNLIWELFKMDTKSDCFQSVLALERQYMLLYGD